MAAQPKLKPSGSENTVAGFRVRPAAPEDLDQIAAAETVCFTDPWSRSNLASLFDNDTVVGLVAESTGAVSRLAGYVFARAIVGEGEILNIAVLPRFRGRGVAARLLDETLSRLAGLGAREVFLEVRESNEAAKRLYFRRGFRPVGLRADYYRKPREHALVLGLTLESASK